ncbi:MAG: PIN domain-containing protein [Thermoplasmatales archaeon]|nr:MAG: PIN domain-containing protein [Thermoplasmatales archaeon]
MASDRLWEDRGSKIVILDTNAILMLFELNINLESELKRIIGNYKIIIPKKVYDELVFFSNKINGKKKIYSKASLDLIKKYEIVESFEKDADNAVFLLAKKTNGIVVTNDKDLRKSLKEKSIKVLFLRAKKKLELE